MTTVGVDKPLYILPFDYRGSFQTKMFGWTGKLSREQTAQIAAAKRVIWNGFTAGAANVPKDQAGVLVDEQFGEPILRDATAQGYTVACPAEVGCIILGRGEDDKKVREWLTTAAGVPGFIGFAGRAVAEIARRYRRFVDIFERAQAA